MAPAANNLLCDLVLGIGSCLPIIPKLFQSESLNKNTYQSISDPLLDDDNVKAIVHFCSFQPKYFSKIDLTGTSLQSRGNNIYVKTGHIIWIMGSCKGLLLLLINRRHYYVFNPITGGFAFIASRKWEDQDFVYTPGPGFVVNLGKPTENADLKLVQVSFEEKNEVVTFNVVPSETPYISFHCPGFGGFESNYSLKAVHLDKRLYWLGNKGLEVLAFNLETEKVRIINGPGTVLTEGIGKDIWFGVAGESLSFVCILPKEVKILNYNFIDDDWEVVYRRELNRDGIRYIVPVFYDGRRLFFEMFKDNVERQIYVLDRYENKWEEGVMISKWCVPNQNYFPFSPSFAKVSDEYLDSTLNLHSDEALKFIEDGRILQSLFSHN